MDGPRRSAGSGKILFTLLLIANLGMAYVLIPHRPDGDVGVADAASTEQAIDDAGLVMLRRSRQGPTRAPALRPGRRSRTLGWAALAGDGVVTTPGTTAHPSPAPAPAGGPRLSPAPRPTTSEPSPPQPTPAPTTSEPAPTTSVPPTPAPTTTEPSPTTTPTPVPSGEPPDPSMPGGDAAPG